MIVYTRRVYASMPNTTTHWPRVVTASFVGFVSTWTCIYDNGTHVVVKGVEGLLTIDHLTPDFLALWYIQSVEKKS